MPSPTTATLVYTVTRAKPIKIADLVTAVGNVVLTTDELTQCGVTLNSDITAMVDGDHAARTIVFDLSADFIVQFPDNTDQAAPFRGLFTQTLSAALKTVVAAAAPVLA
jgi:hypothetical protein